MVSIRSLLATLVVGQALANPLAVLDDPEGIVLEVVTLTKYVDPPEVTPFELNPGLLYNVVADANKLKKRVTLITTSSTTSTTSALPTTTVIVTETSYGTTVTVTAPPGGFTSSTTTSVTTTVSTSTTTSTTSAAITTTGSSTTGPSTTTTTSTTTSSSPNLCPTGTFVLQASGTGDFAVDGNFAQLQSAFGSGYRTLFSSNRNNAQQFKFSTGNGADCALLSADGNLLTMIGGNANLHYVYLFPSVQAAAALVNVNWEALVCTKNADNTLSCTGMSQSIFQVTPGDPTLELGDQNYGEQVTINLVPVPGTTF